MLQLKVKMLQVLIQRDLDTWAKQLVTLIVEDNLPSFKDILNKYKNDKSANLEGTNEWKIGGAPLQKAACKGRNKMIQLLVEAGFNINSFVTFPPANRSTALHMAVLNNHESTVQLLLDLGADKTVKAKWGHNSGIPLAWARQLGHKGIARVLEDNSGRRLTKSLNQHDIDAKLDDWPSTDGDAGNQNYNSLPGKLTCKSSSEEILQDAIAIQAKIAIKSNEIRKLDTARSDLQIKFESDKRALEAKFNADQEQLEDKFNAENIKIRRMRHNLVYKKLALQRHSHFRKEEEIDAMLKGLVEVKEMATVSPKEVNQQKIETKLCPFCREEAEQIFSCEKCDNCLCGNCKEQLINCQKCHAEFTANEKSTYLDNNTDLETTDF